MISTDFWKQVSMRQWELVLPKSKITLTRIFPTGEKPYFVMQTSIPFRVVSRDINTTSLKEGMRKAIEVTVEEIEKSELYLKTSKVALKELLTGVDN